MSTSPYRVTAHNAATASSNRIHADDVAREYGFRGGLVPGVTVYAYLTHPVVEAFGRAWLERGTLSARFTAPFYEGDEVTVTARQTGDDVLDLSATNGSGDVCATGQAWLPAEAQPIPSVADVPAVSLPGSRPAASAEAFEERPYLGAVQRQATDGTGLLGQSAADLPIFAEQGLAHPGWLILGANDVLVANVVLGPWIHVSSDVTNVRAVAVGDTVSTRARVRQVYERKGHRFVELDVLMVVGDDVPAVHVRHTAIYEPRRGRGREG